VSFGENMNERNKIMDTGKIRLRPQEVARADNSITIVVRPQAGGGYMVAAVRIEDGAGLLLGRAFTERVEAKQQVARAVREVMRWLDKMAVPTRMGGASRHRQAGEGVG
jgi:hypothetical protein